MNDKYEQYKKFVLTNCSSTGINSRCNAIESFCEKFDLTITWCGLLPSNQVFTKTLKQMEKDGLIRYAFKNKVEVGEVKAEI